MSQRASIAKNQSYLKCSSLAIICRVDKKAGLLYHVRVNPSFCRFARGGNRSCEKIGVKFHGLVVGNAYRFTLIASTSSSQVSETRQM